jgi:hypothetical protein
MSRYGFTFTERDKKMFQELRNLLKQADGYAPSTDTELVRAAVSFMIGVKRKEFEERHPLGTKGKKREG